MVEREAAGAFRGMRWKNNNKALCNNYKKETLELAQSAQKENDPRFIQIIKSFGSAHAVHSSFQQPPFPIVP